MGQCRYADECVKLCLVKSFCVPLLTYCIGAIDASDQQVKDLTVCWNDSFWRIFGYKRYESVKVLQLYCGELPFDLMYDFIKWKFLTSFSDVPIRFHVFYELNRHKVDSYILNYDHFKCSRSVIANYFSNFIANRK